MMVGSPCRSTAFSRGDEERPFTRHASPTWESVPDSGRKHSWRAACKRSASREARTSETLMCSRGYVAKTVA